PLPATGESVSAFLACEVERGIRPSTIGRRVASIRYAHKLAGHSVPTDDERVKATVRGIRRTRGSSPQEGPGHGRASDRHGSRDGHRPEGITGPRAALDGLRRRLPPLR